MNPLGRFIFQNELRPCLIHGKHKALFHRWEDKSEIVAPSCMVGGHGGGVVRAVLAIVELEDGKVEEVYPEQVTFLDTRGAMSEFSAFDTAKEGSTK